MKYKFVVSSLAAAAALAAQAAAASSTVNIVWHGVDQAGIALDTMDTTVSADFPVTSGYATTALNYSYGSLTGTSFVAYCIEPSEGNGRAGFMRTYNVDSFGGEQARLLQGLFSSSYASTLGSSTGAYVNKAAFQLAVWELVRESGSVGLDVTTGSFRLLSNNAAVSGQANSFLSQALSYQGPALYALTKLTRVGLQDLVTATPLTLAVTTVPEPETYALFLGGLGAIGLVARRRLPR